MSGIDFSNERYSVDAALLFERKSYDSHKNLSGFHVSSGLVSLLKCKIGGHGEKCNFRTQIDKVLRVKNPAYFSSELNTFLLNTLLIRQNVQKLYSHRTSRCSIILLLEKKCKKK